MTNIWYFYYTQKILNQANLRANDGCRRENILLYIRIL